MQGLRSYKNESFLIKSVKGRFNSHWCPRKDVAKELLDFQNRNVLRWDLAETTKMGGRPFKWIIKSGIFVNCIYSIEKIPPSVNTKALESSKREGNSRLRSATNKSHLGNKVYIPKKSLTAN